MYAGGCVCQRGGLKIFGNWPNVKWPHSDHSWKFDQKTANRQVLGCLKFDGFNIFDHLPLVIKNMGVKEPEILHKILCMQMQSWQSAPWQDLYWSASPPPDHPQTAHIGGWCTSFIMNPKNCCMGTWVTTVKPNHNTKGAPVPVWNDHTIRWQINSTWNFWKTHLWWNKHMKMSKTLSLDQNFCRILFWYLEMPNVANECHHITLKNQSLHCEFLHKNCPLGMPEMNSVQKSCPGDNVSDVFDVSVLPLMTFQQVPYGTLCLVLQKLVGACVWFWHAKSRHHSQCWPVFEMPFGQNMPDCQGSWWYTTTVCVKRFLVPAKIMSLCWDTFFFDFGNTCKNVMTFLSRKQRPQPTKFTNVNAKPIQLFSEPKVMNQLRICVEWHLIWFWFQKVLCALCFVPFGGRSVIGRQLVCKNGQTSQNTKSVSFDGTTPFSSFQFSCDVCVIMVPIGHHMI